jgi:hypothetical protein
MKKGERTRVYDSCEERWRGTANYIIKVVKDIIQKEMKNR